MIQAIDAAPQLWRLREFIGGFAHLLDQKPDEERLLAEGGAMLRTLVSVDDWLPAQYAEPDPQRYRQFLLHADSGQRFSVVSFVWGPGQSTPVHDHTVWGLVGMLRGAEYSQSFGVDDGALTPLGEAIRLEPGTVEAISPSVVGLHDVHQVRNAFADQTSISIHVYGANIGAVRRSVYQPDGTRKLFISGYANSTLPNIWDLSVNPSLP